MQETKMVTTSLKGIRGYKLGNSVDIIDQKPHKPLWKYVCLLLVQGMRTSCPLEQGLWRAGCDCPGVSPFHYIDNFSSFILRKSEKGRELPSFGFELDLTPGARNAT